LNHPLPQFNLPGNSDESLNVSKTTFMTENSASECSALKLGAALSQVAIHGISPTNTNATTTGKQAFKTGQRTLLFALKCYF